MLLSEVRGPCSECGAIFHAYCVQEHLNRYCEDTADGRPVQLLETTPHRSTSVGDGISSVAKKLSRVTRNVGIAKTGGRVAGLRVGSSGVNLVFRALMDRCGLSTTGSYKFRKNWAGWRRMTSFGTEAAQQPIQCTTRCVECGTTDTTGNGAEIWFCGKCSLPVCEDCYEDLMERCITEAVDLNSFKALRKAIEGENDTMDAFTAKETKDGLLGLSALVAKSTGS